MYICTVEFAPLCTHAGSLFPLPTCSSKFHPADGSPPVPLDVLAGATLASDPEAACVDERGPRLRIHLQKHPHDQRRHIGVIGLEYYVSKRHARMLPVALEGLTFQPSGNTRADKFLRVSTQVVGGESPLMTFGNSEANLRFIEAVRPMSEVEGNILTMTKYVHDQLDAVLSNVKAILVYHLRLRLENGNLAVSGADSRRSKRRRVDRNDSAAVAPEAPTPHGAGQRDGDPGDAQRLTHALHLHVDSPDSLAWHVSKTKPYGHHSDTRPRKPEHHDNNSDATHESRFRILTHCFAVPVKEGENEVPDSLVSIRHGIPGPDESAEMCEAYGHFCSEAGAFVRATDRDGAILLGSAFHAHLQLPGSQAEQHHYISKCDGVPENGFIRAIASPRQFGPFRRSVRNREQAWAGLDLSEDKVSRCGTHVITNVIDLLCNRVRSFDSLGTSEDDFDSLGTSEDASPSTRPTPSVPARKRRPGKRPRAPRYHKCVDSLRDEERIRRDAVVGAPHNVSTEDVARSQTVACKMMEHRCSIQLTLCSGQPVIVGPMVRKRNGAEGHTLLRPGVTFKEQQVDVFAQLVSTNHQSAVVNKDIGDVIHLRREGKNTWEVLDNAKVALSGRGSLRPMRMRGSGGALYKAGQRMMSSHSKGSHRDAPTHLVSTGQKWTGLTKVMDDCCQHERCLSVFFQGIYLGPFYVSRNAQERVPKKEARDEQERFTKAFAELHELDEDVFPSPKPRDGSFYEMASMQAIGRWFTLTPLDAEFVEKYGKHGRCLSDAQNWTLFCASPDDFVIPMFDVPKEDVANDFGEKYVDVPSLVRHCESLTFLTKEAISRELPDRAHDLQGGNVRVEGGARYTRHQLENVIFHATAVTWGKACLPDIVNQEKGTMAPPRALLTGIITGAGDDSYPAQLKRRNLKPLFVKGVHPGHLSHEPAVHLAVLSTGGYHRPDLRRCGTVTEGGEWIHRRGSDYVLGEETKETAFGIMFRASLCALTNPSCLVDLFLECSKARGGSEENVAPLPESDYFCQFMERVQSHQLGDAIVHPNFRLGAVAYAKVVRGLSSGEGHVFREAVRAALAGGRQKGAEHLRNALNALAGNGSPVFTWFHVQVIMRTIEMCLHEPFGEVTKVHGGPGSEGGAKCFVKQWSGLRTTTETAEEDAGQRGERGTAADMQRLIVEHLNAWADKELRSGDDEERVRRMKKVLFVLGLEWSEGRSRLVHSLGIGKDFDASDSEHILCLINTLHQATTPARTISVSYDVDTAKIFPIRVNVGDLAASKLPFMTPFVEEGARRVHAYRQLLGDPDFTHGVLDDAFRIDNDVLARDGEEEGQERAVPDMGGLAVLDEDDGGLGEDDGVASGTGDSEGTSGRALLGRGGLHSVAEVDGDGGAGMRDDQATQRRGGCDAPNQLDVGGGVGPASDWAENGSRPAKRRK